MASVRLFKQFKTVNHIMDNLLSNPAARGVMFSCPPPYLDLDGWADFTRQSVKAVTGQADTGKLETFTFSEPGKRGKRFVNVYAEFKRMAELAEQQQ